MASGWNLWVWLQCIGVASGCCYKEVPYNRGIKHTSLLSTYSLLSTHFAPVLFTRF